MLAVVPNGDGADPMLCRSIVVFVVAECLAIGATTPDVAVGCLDLVLDFCVLGALLFFFLAILKLLPSSSKVVGGVTTTALLLATTAAVDTAATSTGT